jgi:hypothetical protein
VGLANGDPGAIRGPRSGKRLAGFARPLKRVIQRLVQDPLAIRILEGDFPEGSKILGDVSDGVVRAELISGASALRRGPRRGVISVLADLASAQA